MNRPNSRMGRGLVAAASLALFFTTGCGAMEAMAPPTQPMMDAGGIDAPSMEAAVDMGATAAMDAPSIDLSGGAPSGPQGPAAPVSPTIPPVGVPAPPQDTTGARGAKESAELTQKAPEQMIVFTGRLDLEVEEDAMRKTLHDVIELAAKRGGYIHQQDDRSVTVRVPSASFRETMTALEKLGEVQHRSVQAQDVTERYHDLGVRLKSLLATRARLESFLDRTKTIEEVLRIEQELSRLATEIDQIQGQLRFLAAQASYSTITVAVTPRPKPQKVVVEEKQEEAPLPPPPPPRRLNLPIDWLGDVSLDGLLDLAKGED
ncbi:MAG: DUF4349 domain-containing protein [Polyangiaceae bacterium]